MTMKNTIKYTAGRKMNSLSTNGKGRCEKEEKERISNNKKHTHTHRNIKKYKRRLRTYQWQGKVWEIK